MPNPPVRLYDTSGPGSEPDRGPAARCARPWITARGDVESTRGGRSAVRDDGRAAVRRAGGGPACLPGRSAAARGAPLGDPVTQLHYARQGGDHPGDGLRRRPRGRRPRARARRDRRRAGHPAGQREPPRVRADGDRPPIPREGQRQHRQLGGDLLDRRGGREADLGHPLGGGHGHGPLDRAGHPHHPRVDRAQLARPDRHGARSTRPSRRSTAPPRSSPGTSTGTPSSSRPSRGSTTSRSTPACCSATCRSPPAGRPAS